MAMTFEPLKPERRDEIERILEQNPYGIVPATIGCDDVRSLFGEGVVQDAMIVALTNDCRALLALVRQFMDAIAVVPDRDVEAAVYAAYQAARKLELSNTARALLEKPQPAPGSASVN